MHASKDRFADCFADRFAALAVFAWIGFVGAACGPTERHDVAREPPAAAAAKGEPHATHPAVGSVAHLDSPVRRAFEDHSDFAPLPEPGPEDWLANHEEDGQTLMQFHRARRNELTRQRDIIYVLPLGAFEPERSPSLDRLEDYAERYFGLEVEVLDPVALEDVEVTRRDNSGVRQLYAPEVLRYLRGRLPMMAYCLIGVTMEDLYPDPDWNYVFGYASLRERVGVYSFARYDPAFQGEERGEDVEDVILRRSLKVMAHELGHMFGMQHCVHYSCVMNGTNHLEESDSRPLHMCPVCLRKLHLAVGFEPGERYGKLNEYYDELGFADEARWIERRLEYIRSESP